MLFLIKRIKKEEPLYDAAIAFVVRASSDAHARQIASEQAGDEGKAIWFDAAETQCEVIEPNGPPEVLCRDFMNG